MFVFLALFYIFGILSFFLLDSYVNIILLNIFIITIFLFLIKRYRTYSLFSFALFLGLLVSHIQTKLNSTYIISESVHFINVYAEVYNINKSHHDSSYVIYLKNIIFNNSKINPPSTAKVTYKKPLNIKTGDIINTNLSLFPPSQPLIPYGFNFYKNSFYKKVGANGYVNGNISIIENWNLNNTLFHKINNFIRSIKLTISSDIINNVKNHTAPFLIASTLGEYSSLPKRELKNLRESSLVHLISISGYHIGIIAFCLFFFIRFSLSLIPRISLNYNTKHISAILTIIALLLYILLIGNHTPAIRATICTIAFLIALIFSHKAISINTILLAAILILTFQPFNISSASFLLSFSATLVIIALWKSRLIQRTHYKFDSNILGRVIFYLAFSIILSISIMLITAPILMFFFGKIPLAGVFANVLASPIFAFLIMPSMMFYFILPNIIGIYFLKIASWGMEIILQIAKFTSSLASPILFNFFPAYLLIIFLISLTFWVALSFKYKNILLIPAFSSILYYIFFVKSPDILIDSQMNLTAFKIENSYVLSNNKSKFIQNIWFKNTDNLENIFNNANFLCSDTYCLTNIKNITVSFASNPYNYMEDCNEVDIIILTINAPFSCSKALVMDNNFIKNSGTTFLYIADSKIKISSVK